MKEASDQGRTIAKALAEDLFERFGRDVKQDHGKKMIGRLIKRVLEANGYDHAERGVRCQANPVFSVASTYRCAK